MEKNRLQNRRAVLLCVLALTLLFAALCVRAPYGLDWTDEPYYSVLPYRLWLGDRPLIDTWEVHQLSGLIALPLFRLYLLFTGGSTDGVMLYYRYVLIVFQFAVSLYAFFSLRRKSGDVPALLAAGMLLMHVHFGINGFSYNAITPIFLALSALFTFDALDNPRPELRVTIAGVFYALSVQSYPYALLTLPVFIAFWAVYTRKFAESPAQKRLWKRFALGIAAVTIAFAANILLRSPISEILQNVASILHDPDHSTGSIVKLLGSYCNATRVLFGPVFVAAVALTVYSYIVHFVKNAYYKQRLKQLGLALCVAIVAASVVWVIAYDYPNHHKLNLAAMSVTLILPSLYCLSDFRKSRYFLMVGLGALLSIATQLASNTGIRSSSGMMLLCSVGTMLYFFALLDDEVPRPYGAHTFRVVAAAVCALQLLLTAGLRVVTVYRDSPLERLDTRISDGPAKGVVTTRENVTHYDGIVSDLRTHTPESGSILVTSLLPVAYLVTDLVPATPSAFNMTADSPWLAEYYEKHPEREPALFYAADRAVGQSNELSLNGAAALVGTLGMEEIAGVSGTVFVD